MMNRAAVLIGVANTGGLPKLHAVQSGVESVRAWATQQPGMMAPDGSLRITVLTDAAGTPVTAKQIKDAVRGWIDEGTIEQLLIYFAGHGASVQFSETWLLSGAPDESDEAVNVEGSIVLARHCGIPHVVMISDACRTPAADLQSQMVTGVNIFPNRGAAATVGFVDIFYATAAGRPALEVSTAAAPTQFTAVYTESLVKGLTGQASPTEQVVSGTTVRRIFPWPLQDFLEDAVPGLLISHGVTSGRGQKPDALITSRDGKMWLAELVTAPTAAPAPQPTPSGAPADGDAGTTGVPPSTETVTPPADGVTLRSVSQDLVRAALDGGPTAAPPAVERAPTRGGTRSATRGPKSLPDRSTDGTADTAPPRRSGTQAPARGIASDAVRRFTAAFRAVVEATTRGTAPLHFESNCGFKVTGIGVQDVVIPRAGHVEILDANEGLVRLWNVQAPAANMLVVFSNGTGALLPAVPGFIASITYDDSDGDGGELVNVSFEPSDFTPLYQELKAQLPAVRELRGIIAAASRLGVFRPDDLHDQEQLIARLRNVQVLDQTMAVYAAYALHRQARPDAIVEMTKSLRTASGFTLFDVEMLASPPREQRARMPDDVFPAIPLLSQGWRLLDAFSVELPPTLAKVRTQQVPSLWTLLSPEGVSTVREAFTLGEIS